MRNFESDLADVLRARRKQLHLTQEYVAGEAEIDQSLYSRLERKKCRLNLLHTLLILRALQIDVVYLYYCFTHHRPLSEFLEHCDDSAEERRKWMEELF